MIWPLAYIDLRPLWYAGGLVLLVPLAVGVAWGFNRGWRSLKSGVYTALVWTAVFWLPMTLWVDNRRLLGFEMGWRIDTTDHGEVAVLTYLSSPANYELFRSPDLVDWLQKRKPIVVGMSVTTVSDFGSLRTYSIDEVGPFGRQVAISHEGGNPPWDLLRAKAAGR